MNPIATVVSMTGTNYAKSASGEWRKLNVGDVIYEGDVIVTSGASTVEFELSDGTPLLVSESGELRVTAELLAFAPPSADENAIEDADIANVLEALETGVDLSEVIDETAAGSGPGNEGHDFVRLARIVENLPDIEIAADTLQAAEIVDLEADAERGPAQFPASELRLLGPESVLEGEPVSYTVLLDGPALSDLQVSLTNGLVVTVPAGQLSGSAELIASDDVYVGGSNLTAEISDVTGGGLQNLSIISGLVETQVLDDSDETQVLLGVNATVAEGGEITYTASVSSPTASDLTLFLDNSLSIVIAAGQTSGSVVGNVANDVYGGERTLNANIVSAEGGGFENLVINPQVATSSVTNSVDTTSLTLQASGTAVEGGVVTYIATLSNPAGSDMSITLDNGDMLTIREGDTRGEIDIAVPDDAYQGEQQFITASVVRTSGGNFEDLQINSVATEIIENETLTRLELSATENVQEGGEITYTATLDHPAGSDMTVRLDNGQSILITSGASSGSVTYTTEDDVYAVENTLSVGIADVQGGSFEHLEVSEARAITTVSNNSDTTTLRLIASETVLEGENIIYTLQLDSPANSDLVVELDNGELVTIAAGNSEATVAIVTESAGSVSVAISEANGGGFEELFIDRQPAITLVRESVSVTLSGDSSVVEGEAITYVATLSEVLGTPVTINLDNNLSITIAAGETRGEVSLTTVDDVYVSSAPQMASIVSATAGDTTDIRFDSAAVVTSIIENVDITTLVLSAPAVINEGENLVYTASLSAAAQNTVNVELSNGTSIQIAAGASSGSVSIPVSDDIYQSSLTESAHIISATGGGFEQLEVDSTVAVTQIVDTTESTSLTLSASETVSETGGVISYTASLENPAQTPVEVVLSNGQLITIAANENSGTVDFVFASQNDVYLGGQANISTSIVSASGGNFENLLIDPAPAVTSVVDSLDTTSVSLSATGNINETGGVIHYTALVTHPAQTAMTVILSNGEAITIAEGETSATLDLVIEGQNDVYLGTASEISAYIVSTEGGNFENVEIDSTPAITTVADTIDSTLLSLSASSSVSEAGGSIFYTATLDSPAGTDITVNLSNGESIVIAAGETSGNINVDFFANEDVYSSSQSISVSITSAEGGNFENLTIDSSPVETAIRDTIDTTSLNLTASHSVSEAGGVITYTATIDNPAQTALRVNLSNGEFITISAGESAGSIDVTVDADEDAYLETESISTSIVSATGGNFENLEIDSTPAVTTIADTVDSTTVSLTATHSVSEAGGIITYTASVDNPAETAVTVNLSNGEVITISAGESSGSVDVAVDPDEDVYAESETISVSVTSATGGNFEDLEIDSTPSVTHITDTVDTTTVSLTATNTLSEAGGTITYTARVDHPAETAVAVNLSNGAVITIAAGETTGFVDVAVDAEEDVYLETETISTSIVSATGGNFEDLEIDSTPAVTTITDTVDITTVRLAATNAVSEAGGIITYTAFVDNPAETSVTVGLSNGEVITIAAGESSGSVDVNVDAEEDVYVEADTISVSIASAVGGNFEGLEVDSTPVITAITDTDNTTTVRLTATGSVSEAGGTITYTANVDNVAESAVTVNLSNGEVITIAAGETAGSVDVNVDAEEDVYLESDSVSASIVSATGGNFEVLEIDSTPAVTAVTDTADATTVSLAATNTVSEAGGTITYAASVDNPTQTALIVNLSNGEVITIAAGESSGSVDVAVDPDEDAYLDEESVSASITSASGGNFENLLVDATPAVTIITDTIDTVSLSLSAPASVLEGEGITYTASLGQAAGSDVNVVLSNGSTILISAGNTFGTTTIAADDDVYLGGGTASLFISSASGGNFENLQVDSTPVATTIIDDNDPVSLNLSAPANAIEGQVITYTATLAAAAASPVTVSLASGAVIEIAAGSTTGSIAITLSDDVYAGGGSHSESIASASGGGFENLVVNTAAVTTLIADDSDASSIALVATDTVNEGGAITYTALLDNTADTPVTVNLSNGETIVIAAGAISGSVNVVAGGGSSVSASILSTSGGNFENLIIDGTPAITSIVDLAPQISVTAVDVTEESVVSGDVIASFTSSDPGGDGLSHQLLNNDSGYFILVGNDIRLTQTGVDAINNDVLALTSLTITVEVSADGVAVSDSDTSVITRVNEAPVAGAENYSVVEGASLSVTAAAGVLVNDSDPEGSSLSALEFASDTLGTNAALVDGSTSVSTAQGGTVTLFSDGSFNYTAPLSLDHSLSTPVDSFAYRASDGALGSAWTPVTIAIGDTAPTAMDDLDSVGFGGTINGNVISGQGGNGSGEDVLGQDATQVLAVEFDGVARSNFDGSGNLVIDANYGTLTINQNGSYRYISNQSLIPVAMGGGDTASWSNAGITLYGFNAGTDFDSSGTLDLASADGTGNIHTNSGNGLGLNSPGDSDSANQLDQRGDNAEAIALDLNANVIAANFSLGIVNGNDGGEWYAYDENLNLVSNASFAGGTTQVSINPGTAFRYVVFTAGDNNDDYTLLSGNYILDTRLSERFVYTLQDSDGDTSAAELTLNHDPIPEAIADTSIAYESSLINGSEAGSRSNISSGNLLDNDEGLTSAAEITEISFEGASFTPNGSGVITASSSQGQLLVYTEDDIDNGIRAGDYQYTLLDNNLDGDNSSEIFGYVLSDGINSSTSELSVQIVDDAPVGGDITTEIRASDDVDTYNLIVVLDRSGSMSLDVNGNASSSGAFDPTQVRMDVARDALRQLFESYESVGNVNIQIVDFSYNVARSGWYQDDIEGANNYLSGLTPGGGTQYSTALNGVMNEFSPPAGDKTLVYFISDGEPSDGHGVDATQQASWETFLDSNSVDIAFGIGVGSVSLAAIEPVAYPNTDADNNGAGDYAIQVDNANELADTLLATLESGVVSGSISIMEGDGSTGFFVGADGGYIQSVVVDGTTYTYNPGVLESISVTTALGGTLSVDFLSGEYSYRVDVDIEVVGEQEVFTITAVDGDGDSLTADLTVNLEYSPALDANRDSIISNRTDNTVSVNDAALLHNDVSAQAGNIVAVGNALNGTVAGPGPSTFVYTAGNSMSESDFGSSPAEINEMSGDSEATPLNNSLATAFDFSDRSLFSNNDDDINGVNVDGYSVAYYGTLNSDGSSTQGADQDWLKLGLAEGENIWFDIDNAGVTVEISVYDASGVFLQTIADNSQPWGGFTATYEGEYYAQISTVQTGNAAYELYMTINSDNAVYVDDAASFEYSVTDGTRTDATIADITFVDTADLAGTERGEILVGRDSADIISAGDGDDAVLAGSGNDRVDGGSGADLLFGGAGNDTLSGGVGADIFAWELTDSGSAGSPAVDQISDFDNSVTGDALDLRDLLVDESDAILSEFLHIEVQSGNTLIHISSSGGFDDGVYNSAQEDQTIELVGVDLVTAFAGDQDAIIQDLINRGKIITD